MVHISRLLFTFADITVSLVGDRPLLTWCITYFQHYISLTDRDRFDIEIELTDDYKDYVSRAYAHKVSNPIMYLSYDDQFRHYLVYFLPHVDRNRSFMRLVRNLILNQLQCRNFIFLHAACVSFLEIGVGIIGDRMAGKTTTCLSLLSKGFAFTTNDKLAVTVTPQGPEAIGIPVSIGIRQGTRELFPNIHYTGEWSSETDKIYLTPQCLCEQFHTDIRSCAMLRLFLLPVYDPSADTLVISELTMSEKQELIEKQILGSVYGDYILYKQPQKNTMAVTEKIKCELLQIPFLQIRQNSQSLNNVPEYIKRTILHMRL